MLVHINDNKHFLMNILISFFQKSGTILKSQQTIFTKIGFILNLINKNHEITGMIKTGALTKIFICEPELFFLLFLSL